MTNKFNNLLSNFALIEKNKNSDKTYLEIAKCSHNENVWSNILAFYFNPNLEHNFNELILKTFLQIDGIGAENQKFNNNSIKVHREFSTAQNKRIDIVVEADTFVLGIENKVNAPLNNDLSDYSVTIDSLAKEKKSYKVVLSKYKCQVDSGFINLLYNDFVKHFYSITKVKDNTNKYKILFDDFIDTINNEINYNPMNNNPEMVKFFTDNNSKINELLEYSDKMNDFVFRKLQIIHDSLATKFKGRYKRADCLLSDKVYQSNFYFESFILQITIPVGGVNYYSSFYRAEDWEQLPDNKAYEFQPTDKDEMIIEVIEQQIQKLLNK